MEGHNARAGMGPPLMNSFFHLEESNHMRTRGPSVHAMHTCPSLCNQQKEINLLNVSQAYCLPHAGFLLGLLLDPEDGDDKFLPNIS
jgi:hypothetical protein